MSEIEHVHPNFITSGERTAKMMVIMLGICIAGGAIFFGMGDYWISSPPPAASIGAAEAAEGGTFTGQEILSSLSFVESKDFRTLAFNSLPGEPDNNPTINDNEVGISCPVKVPPFAASAAPIDAAGGGDDIQ